MSKYVNGSGVSEMWQNIKNYISAQLLNKSNVGHKHSASDITSGLANVATSGSYNDLSNKPTIPKKTSELINDRNFITGVSWEEIENKPSTFTPSAHTHDDRYYTETEVNNLLGGKAASNHNHNSTYLGISAKAESAKSADSVAWANVSGKPSTFAPSSHTHDDRYYTETEVNNLLGGKANSSHTHSYNDLSNKPTIITVNNATLTIQKNGTNVATFTSNSNTDVTANITVPTKTSELINDSGFLTLQSLSANSIPFHNSYPRCKYLGTSITDAQNTAIKNRTYDDLFIGDYWTINGVNWRIVAIDYYFNVGDTNFDKGNIIVMPDTVLYNAQMNATGTTADAYSGSLMRTQNLNNARTIAQNAFGSHLANHRILLANSVDNSGPNNWSWCDSDGVELPNEVQIYGTRVWGSALKGFDVATQKYQFPLLALAPQFVNIRQGYWLQDVSSLSVSSLFALAPYDCYVASYIASYSAGVRPSVTLSYI